MVGCVHRACEPRAGGAARGERREHGAGEEARHHGEGHGGHADRVPGQGGHHTRGRGPLHRAEPRLPRRGRPHAGGRRLPVDGGLRRGDRQPRPDPGAAPARRGRRRGAGRVPGRRHDRRAHRLVHRLVHRRGAAALLLRRGVAGTPAQVDRGQGARDDGEPQGQRRNAPGGGGACREAPCTSSPRRSATWGISPPAPPTPCDRSPWWPPRIPGAPEAC